MRNIGAGQETVILEIPIVNGMMMVDFGNPPESRFGRYYSLDEFQRLGNIHPVNRVPITNVVNYIARVGPIGGRRTQTRRSRKTRRNRL